MPEITPYDDKPVIPKDQAKLLYEILSDYRSDQGYYEPQIRRWKENYRSYRAFIDPNSHAYKYNPVSFLTYTLAEDVVATVCNAFFERDRLVDVVPQDVVASDQFGQLAHIRPDINDKEVARQIQKAINMYLQHPDTEFDEFFEDFVRQAVLYGISWSTITAKFKENEFKDLMFTGPCFEVRDVYDVMINKTAYKLSKRQHLFFRESVTFAELKKREQTQDYFNVDLLKNDDWVVEDDHDDLRSELGEITKYFSGSGSMNLNNIQLVHFYKDRHVVTVAGWRTIVQDTTKPKTIGGESLVYPPYDYDIWDMVKYSPLPLELFALGLPDVTKDSQDRDARFKRWRDENIEISLQKVFRAELDFIDDEDMIVFAPGNIINAPRNTLEVLDVGDITQSSYQESGIIMQEAKAAATSLDISRGERTPGKSTAAQNILLNRNAAKRINRFIKRLNDGTFKSWCKKILIQMRQYMRPEEYERMIGEPDMGFYTMSTDEIDRMLDVRPTAASVDYLKEQEIANFVQLAQVSMNAPETNRREVLKFGWERHAPYTNPEKFLIPEQQMQMMQQQAQGQPPPAKPTRPQAPGQSTISEDQLLQAISQGQIG